MARLVLWPVALVGGVVWSVVGCTGGTSAIVTETPIVEVTATASPSPSVSVSPSPTALTPEEILEAIPENARSEDFASASEFARFFVLTWGEMYQSGDGRLFEGLSAEGCDFCTSSLEDLSQQVAEGLRTEGGAVSVSDGPPAGGLQDDGTWNASFDIEVAASKLLDSSGATVREYPEELLRVGVELEFVDGHWRVRGVASESR